MKKILYMMSLAAAVLFTSCTEDKGTSTEVVDANSDERVNPDHLRNYDKPGTASYTNVPFGAVSSASEGTETPAEDVSAVEIVYAYYNVDDPELYYNYSATHYVGGTTDEPNNTMNRDKLDTDAKADVRQTEPAIQPGESTDNVMIRNKEERLSPHEDRDN